jgi:rubredoxin
LTDMNNFVVKCEYCGTIYDVDEGEEIWNIKSEIK